MEHVNWRYDDNDIFDDGSSDSENASNINTDEEQPQHLNPSVVIINSPEDVDISDDEGDADTEGDGETDEIEGVSDEEENDSEEALNLDPHTNDSEDVDTEIGYDEDDDDDVALDVDDIDELLNDDLENDDGEDTEEEYIQPQRRFNPFNVLDDNSSSSSSTQSSGGSTTVSAVFSNYEANNDDMIVEAEFDVAETTAGNNATPQNPNDNSDIATIIYIADNEARQNPPRSSQTAPTAPTATAVTVEQNVSIYSVSTESDEPETPSRKRKRLSSASPKRETPKMKADKSDDDEDDGLTCPICLDTWEMSGQHRLVSLRCGHLFGESCIRRWLSESSRQSGSKLCPQCKTKASPRDIRSLYARRVRALDRTEEHNLRDQLELERKRYTLLQNENVTMKMSAALFKSRIEILEKQNEYMKSIINRQVYTSNCKDGHLSNKCNLKIYLERTMEICREPGCRVMSYSRDHATLFVSQKTGQKLFPGYGVRFIDVTSFRTKHYIHASSKLIRDICVSADERVVAVAGMEPTSRVIDIRTGRCASNVTVGSSTPLWACDMDVCSSNIVNLYLGAQIGVTYVYDIRKPNEALHEYIGEGDSSPVVKISQIPVSKTWPLGGFLVCTLRNLWFYENVGADQPKVNRLNVEGPFISMNFNKETEMLLVTTRSNANFANSRYILGKLERDGDVPFFKLVVVFFGAKATPIMTRSSQLLIDSNTLVTGYVQDAKVLTLYDVRRETRLQSVPVQEVVFDTCPIYTSDATYLAALTESKCRIYKVSGAE